MGLKVLSLFDGMSCGQIALERAGFKDVTYLSSEIKGHAIRVTQDNYPSTIQVGDITKISYCNGVLKTSNGNFEIGEIDLVIGGSPCQDLSQANKNIQGLDGEKSKLFFEWLRLCHEICPKYFLLENVRMPKDQEQIITDLVGVEPVFIDSAIVAPALRKRNYWTNIQFKNNIENEYIMLNDILQDGYSDRQKARCLLESDSRPLTTPVKMFHRYYSSGFTTLIFKSKQHYLDCLEHYNNNYKGLAAKDIFCDSDVYNGVRYMNQTELEKCQTVPVGYTKSLNRNDAACLLGDGWTVDIIAHIFKHIEL